MILLRKIEYSRVSVIITNHNYEKYLTECINSVVNQKIPSNIQLEIIVVDDSSHNPCGAENIVKQYGNNILFKSVQFSNPLYARHYGFQISNGDYIIFLDADDKLGPDYIKSGVHTIQDVDIVYSDIQYFGDEFKRTYIDPNININDISLYNFMHVGCMVRRSALLSAAAFDHGSINHDYHEDWYLWRKLISRGHIAKKQNNLYYARVHKNCRSILIKEQDYYDYRGSCMDTISLCGFTSLGFDDYFPKYQSWPKEQIHQYILNDQTKSIVEYYSRIPSGGKIQIVNLVSRFNYCDHVFYYNANLSYDLDICEILLRHMDNNFGIVHNNKYDLFECTLASRLVVGCKQYVDENDFVNRENILYIF